MVGIKTRIIHTTTVVDKDIRTPFYFENKLSTPPYVTDLCPNGWHLDSFDAVIFDEEVKAEILLSGAKLLLPTLSGYDVVVGYNSTGNVPCGSGAVAFISAFNLVNNTVDENSEYFLTNEELNVLSQFYFETYGVVCRYVPPLPS